MKCATEVCVCWVCPHHIALNFKGTLSVCLCYITDWPKMWLKTMIFIIFHILWIGSNFALPVLPAFTQAAACRWRISCIQRLRGWHVWDWVLAVGWEPHFSSSRVDGQHLKEYRNMLRASYNSSLASRGWRNRYLPGWEGCKITMQRGLDTAVEGICSH